MTDDYGSKPWRGWTPEQLLEFRQRPKKKRKLTGREVDEMLRNEPKRATEPTDS